MVETDEEKQMRDFCTAVGELILWASAIDSQLTKAVIRYFTLTETPLLEPVISELPVRTKIDLLRSRSKHITASDWSNEVKSWTNKAEKVNGYRNIAAHHQVVSDDNGKPILFSAQARKLLRRIDGSEVQPARTIDDIHKWVKKAKEAFTDGEEVLVNLDRFAEKKAEHQAK